MAAVLAVDDAILSHDSAGRIHRVFNGPLFPIHVITEGTHKDQPRLVVHRSQLIPRADRHKDGALPVTSLPLTLIDLAATLGDDGLRTAVERLRSPLHVAAMSRCLDRHAGRRGAKRVKRLLAVYDTHTRSYLERAFLKLCRDHGLPKPRVNQHVEGRERDFVWPEHHVAAEADGRAFHGTVTQHAKDDRRDLELTLAGWRPARFSYERIVLDPGDVAEDLRRLLVG